MPGAEYEDPASALALMFGGSHMSTFLGLESRPVADAAPAHVAILGADTATPYPAVGPYCAGGADAIRQGSAPYAGIQSHWNFDLGRPALPEGAVVDCGNLPMAEHGAANRAALSGAVRALRAQGVVPVILGGDDSVPIPVLDALGPEPLWIVQVDAHIDWRDEVEGERMGLSSNMRRASEMDHVEGIIQIGQRGLGSARKADVAAARDWGVHFFPARGLEEADPLAPLPDGARVAVVFDFDALDPGIMPALIAPTAGGLSYWQVIDLFDRVAARAEIAGITMCEFMPSADRNAQGAILAGQILTTWLGRLTG
ncbi:arginase family protein [Ovoidimarina sediminis]|uniref:arginase family protein n=1 Tax=Ovoidimarina sediminis TaxID=3079856 RepID=UPI00290D5477|nr:arginase family protein [Rhodophyticola sp. MJ-SS7]MDU8942404.1 arginase family protein [Rhodophyticola sp. MJ-SS7]